MPPRRIRLARQSSSDSPPAAQLGNPTSKLVQVTRDSGQIG